MNRHYLECACSCPEHVIRVSVDEEYKEMIIEVCMVRPSFWRRVWLSLKYVFSINDCHYEETLLDLDQVKNLHSVCDKFIKDIEYGV